MSQPLTVNLFAAPGSGKSVMAAGLFYRLKSELHVNAELTGEYAKDLVWSGRLRTLEDQIYVFGKQHNRVQRLQKDCEVVISDSPILMGLIYAPDYPQCFRQTVAWAFNRYNNINFLVERTGPYNPVGRNQTEAESDEIQEQIVTLLEEHGQTFTRISGDHDGLGKAFDRVKKSLSNYL